MKKLRLLWLWIMIIIFSFPMTNLFARNPEPGSIQAPKFLQQDDNDPTRSAERLLILLKKQKDKEKEALLQQKRNHEEPAIEEVNNETTSAAVEENTAILEEYGFTEESLVSSNFKPDELELLAEFYSEGADASEFDDELLPAYKDWLSDQEPPSEKKPNVYKANTITGPGDVITLNFPEFQAPSWVFSADSMIPGANLNEDFEDGVIPDNWTVINADGGTHWWEPTTVNPHGGIYAARVHWESTTLDNDDWLITPPLFLSSDSVNEISFWMRTYNGTYDDPWEVLVSTTNTNPASFTVIDSGPGMLADYVKKSYSLDSYGDAIAYVAIRYIGSYDWYLYVDDFVGPPVVTPSCPAPANLSATNLTISSADLGWTSQGDETTWNIAWGDPGFDPSIEGTLIPGVTSNPYTLTGLDMLTEYEFYVQAECGVGDTSVWAGPLLFQTTSNPLSGNYTINSTQPTGGTNFNSFNDFTSAINLGGLAGPVIVDVVSGTGPYNEQVLFNELPNSSETNTLTINGNGETLEYLSTVTNSRATLKFDGTDYVIVDSLNVTALGENSGEYGWAVCLSNNADHNTFTNCIFTATSNATSTNFAVFVTSNSSTGATTAGLAVSNLTVDNCTTYGGYYSMVINGPTTAPYAENNVITNNEIRDFYYYGLYIRGNNNSVISGNMIHRPDRPTVSTAYMLYMTSNMSGTVITKNRISEFAGSGNTTSTAYGVYGTTLAADIGAELLLANNVISGYDNMNGTNYGMYFSTASGEGNLLIYHNSLSVDNVDHPGSSLIRGIYQTGANAKVVILNNNISVTSNSTGIKYCIYLATNTASVTSDYNNLFMGATAGTNNIGYWDGTSFLTLADWKTANNGQFGQNSTDVDPLFASPPTGNLMPGNPLINNIGTDLTNIVPDDINGVLRTSTPDPGAYEFDVTGCIQPGSLTADNILGNQADLSWTDNNVPAATMWDIELGPAGFTPSGVPTAAGVTNNPFTYTGLSANTDYEWYVRAICGVGDSSSWVGPGAFTTACSSLPAPFAEHFQNTTIPNCWSMYGPDDWLFTTDWPDYGAADLEDHTGTNGSFAGVDGSTPANVTGITLESPAIDVSTLDEPQLRFYLFNNNINNDDYQTLSVDLWNGTAWNNGIYFWGPTDNDSSWVEVQMVLSPFNITGDIKLRFVVDKSTGNPFYDDLIIDDVYIEEAPACPNPVSLGVANVTATSADLTWGSASGLSDVEFGPAGFTPTGVPTHSEVVSPLSITGLTPATSYSFYVRDICGPGEYSNWVGPFTFTTECATFIAPFIETFENTTIPNCWVMYGPDDWLFTTTWPDYGAADIEDHTGTGGSFAGVDGSTPANITGITLETPFIDVSALIEPQLRFYLFNNNEDNTDYLTLSVDLWDGSTWNNGIFYWGPTDNDPDWVEVEAVLAPYTITGDIQFRFVVDKSAGSPYYDDLIIDDIFVEEAPACPKPVGLGAENITATSADLTWTSISGLSDVEFGLAGFTPTGVPTDPDVVSPLSFTDLTPATSYAYYVRDVCGGGEYSNWSGPFVFNTECATLTAPYFEPFQDQTIPNCWEISGPQDWLFTNTWPGYGAAGLQDHTGTGGSFAGVDGSGTAGLTGITLETPLIDVTTLIVPQLRFFLFNNNVDNTDWQSLTVDLWDGTAWNDSIFVWGANDNNPDWVEVEVVLSPYTITGDIRFRFIVDKSTGLPYYDDIVIDDVHVEEAPACPKPINLGVANITSTSADLTWTSLSGLSDIEFGLAGFTPTGIPTDPNVTSPFSMTGLSSSTSYSFYVRDVCTGGDYSNWNGPFTFSTPCDVFDIPFAESFDGASWPICWTQTYEGGLTGERWSVAATNQAGGTPYEMEANWENNTGISRLILPPLNLSGTVPSLRFKHFYDAYGTAATLTHKIQTSSDGINWTDENFSFVSGGSNIGPETIEINLNNNIGPNTYIAFVMDGNHFQFDGWFIDDVEVFQNLFGTLAGTVTELATGNPIEGAQITVGPYSGISAADGTYSFNVLIGTYMAGCTATGYNPQSDIEVVIEDGLVTPLDFELTAPQFVVDQNTVSVVLNPDQQLDETLNISNPGNGSGSWTGGLIEIDKESKDLFDLQFDWPTQGNSAETSVATDGDFIYTSTWSSSNFHKYNMDGTYIGSFTCGVAGGVRDLTYDGTYFYGAAANASIFEMDLANGTVISTFSAPTQVRAIAYDEAQDVFYGNNMATDIVKFNKSGTNLGSFPVGPNGTDYYGFAVDNYSPGAPYLWGYSRTGTSMNQLIQIQLPDGTETGVSFDVGSVVNVNSGLAGGLVISKKLVPGLQVLTGIVVGERVWGLELTEAGPDWCELSPIGGTLAPGEDEDFTLSFDATGMMAGVYEAELHLNFSPNVGSQVIPITMTIDETIVAPVNLASSYDCTDVELTWEMPAGASPDSWNIYRDGELIGNVSGMTFSESMLNPDVEYCFEVTALYGGVESSPAGPECITIPMPENVIPTDLEGIANSPDGNNITLNWTAPTGCVTPDGYNIYRDSVMINPEMLTDLTYVDTLMETGTYVYAVSAVYYFGEMMSDTNSVYILIVGLNEHYTGELLVFPNPASQYVQVQSDVQLDKVTLLDNAGREIQTVIPAETNYRINIANLERGIYYLRIETEKGQAIRKITLN